MNHNDGGPAFPGAFSGHCGKDSHMDPCGCYVDTGMTLRDYFAAAALPSVIAGCTELAKLGSKHGHDEQARAAYLIADEMLIARKRQESSG